jgi:hypothetical protein
MENEETETTAGGKPRIGDVTHARAAAHLRRSRSATVKNVKRSHRRFG